MKEAGAIFRNLYYSVKPVIPRKVQILLRRRWIFMKKRSISGNVWPIDAEAGKPPDGWTGWPTGKQFALVLTHDVETAKGQGRCHELIRLEKELGFRSCFNFVPERHPGRYDVSSELRQYLKDHGFEVGVHGLHHDGKLYMSREIFVRRAARINHYVKEWDAVGFRSPSMHHNLEWIHDLDIEYDASTFDTDPFEPQADGMGTIFPFWVGRKDGAGGYIELPYTLAQDFTLFILLRETTIDIWKGKLDWIAEKGGMALVNTHPDYMRFAGNRLGSEEYPAQHYEKLLEYVRVKYDRDYWHVLPKDIGRYWATIFAPRTYYTSANFPRLP